MLHGKIITGIQVLV